jgi:hypothetical protein
MPSSNRKIRTPDSYAPGFYKLTATGTGFETKEISRIDVNVAKRSSRSAMSAVGGVRPPSKTYPNLCAINQLNSIANSGYHSLQVSLRQQVWKGLTANGNYT